MKLGVEIAISPELTRALDALENNAPARRDTLLEMGFLVQDRARSHYLNGAALFRQTGKLARGISIDKSGLPDYVEVGSPEVYGKTHEFGATIRPKGGGFLVFGLGTNGGPPIIRTREVQIPARPWLGPSVEDSSAKFAEVMIARLAAQAGV